MSNFGLKCSGTYVKSAIISIINLYNQVFTKQQYTLMLGNLLKTLKSQKSNKSISQLESNTKSMKSDSQTDKILTYKIPEKIMQNINSVIQSPMPKIRYFTIDNLPNFFNRVVGCPISVFHILPHSQRKVKQIDLTKHPYPQYLQFLKPILNVQVPTYNHLLINDYPPGIGIMPHSDGPAYLPKVFVLSLNSYCIINFQRQYSSSEQVGKYNARLLLQPNSVHIFQQQAYTSYLHGIQNYMIDSVFVKYDAEQKRVQQSTINNYNQLACKEFIEGEIEKGVQDREYGDFRILKLQNNQRYTHKIEFIRKQRISITIRQKYNTQIKNTY